MKARITAAGIAFLVTAGIAGASAAPAQAVTPGCNATAFCGAQILPGTNGMAMAASAVKVGAPVTAAAPSADPLQDWYQHNPPATASNAKTFELAPNGLRSGLCVSIPSSNRQTPAVLRRCNDSQWQQFTATPSQRTPDFYQWISGTSGELVLTDPHMAVSGTQLQARRSRDGGNQDWEYTNAVAVTSTTTALITGSPAIVHPDTPISQTCDSKGSGDCIQASGGAGGIVTAHPQDKAPNQQFAFFNPPSPVCGNNISTSTCPFPGAPAGKQIAILGGQSTGNAGSCVGFSDFNPVEAKLVNCNGGTGTIVVLDGYAIEIASLGRQSGGKVYMCETGSDSVQAFTGFATGSCQWTDETQ